MIKTTINKDAITIHYFFHYEYPSGLLSKLSEFSNVYVCNLNSFLARGEFCCLLIAFANSLDLIICLFDLILYVPSTIFQLYRDGSSWVEPVLS